MTKLMLLGVLAGRSACTTYYKVTDPTSQKVDYTTAVDQPKGGSVSLEDATSGAQATIQNSEVVEGSSDEYKTATARPKKQAGRCRGRTAAAPAVAATS